MGRRARTPRCPHEASGTCRPETSPSESGHPGTQCGPCAPLGASQGDRRGRVAVFPPPQRVALLARQKPGTVLHPHSPHRVRGAKAKWGSPSCLPASGWSAEVGLWEVHQDGGPHSLRPKLTLGETPWVLADPMGRVGSRLHRSRSRPGPGVGRGGCGTHILHLEGLLLQRLHGQDVLDGDTVERQVPCGRSRHERQEGLVPRRRLPRASSPLGMPTIQTRPPIWTRVSTPRH